MAFRCRKIRIYYRQPFGRRERRSVQFNDVKVIEGLEQHINQQTSAHDKGRNRVASVAFPNAVPGIYDYLIPDRLTGSISPGTPVLVSLRKRQTWGVAVVVKAASSFPELKEIIDIKSSRWTDEGGSLIELYKWVAEYYQCDLGRVFRPFLRKGLADASAKTVRMYVPDRDMPADSLNEKDRSAPTL